MNKSIKFQTYLTLLLFTISSCLWAQEQEHEESVAPYYSSKRNFDYQVRIGTDVGGTAPMGLPKEIRKLNSFSMGFPVNFSADVTYWLDDEKKWGLRSGVAFLNQKMRVDANVKNYGMEIIQKDNEGRESKVRGNFTGDVYTEYRSFEIAVPLLVELRTSKNWRVNLGPYISYSVGKRFRGHVHDGYFRNINPTGIRTEFKDGSAADYDFSDNLNDVNWGIKAGAEVRVYKRLIVYGGLKWGLNDIFNKDFDVINYNLYPIYFHTGLGYLLF